VDFNPEIASLHLQTDKDTQFFLVCNAASGIPFDGITTDAFICFVLEAEKKPLAGVSAHAIHRWLAPKLLCFQFFVEPGSHGYFVRL
jgi:hypothetical protein